MKSGGFYSTVVRSNRLFDIDQMKSVMSHASRHRCCDNAASSTATPLGCRGLEGATAACGPFLLGCLPLPAPHSQVFGKRGCLEPDEFYSNALLSIEHVTTRAFRQTNVKQRQTRQENVTKGMSKSTPQSVRKRGKNKCSRGAKAIYLYDSRWYPQYPP